MREDLQESDRKSREQPTPKLQNSDALGHGGVGGAIQAACRQPTGNNPMLGQSLKKVLHAYDLWPQVLNPGVWEACDFKI